MKKAITILLVLATLQNVFAQTGGYTCQSAVDAGCNYIPNPSFRMGAPTNITWAPFTDFQHPALGLINKHVYDWRGSVGSADINGSVSVPKPAFPAFLGNVNYASMACVQNVRAAYTDPDGIFHPASNLAYTEGISAKIRPLLKGKEYALSFFTAATPHDQEPGVPYSVLTNFSFKIVLAKCASFPNYGEGNNYPDGYACPPVYPAIRQVIYCEAVNTGNFNWKQSFVQFTANDDYDLIWIFPEKTPAPGDAVGNYASFMHFAYPELVDATPAISLPDANCEVTVTACTVTNAQYTWTDPAGNKISSQPQITVDARSNPGMYAVTIDVNAAQVANTCSRNDTKYTVKVPVGASCGCSPLQITNGSLQYYDESFGSPRVQDLLANCGNNTICHEPDEGGLRFSLTSAEPQGNHWEVFWEGIPVQQHPNVSIQGSPVFDQQQFELAMTFIGYNSPTTVEVRLTNTQLNETRNLFVTLQPCGTRITRRMTDTVKGNALLPMLRKQSATRQEGTANSQRTTIDCSAATKGACNYIANNIFWFNPGTNTSFDVFGEGNVPSWISACPTPDVNPAWTSTVSPANAPSTNFAWMAATSNYPNREIYTEGIAQKIPRLTPGDSYSLSFFLQKTDIVGYGGWQTGSMDEFNIVLMHCEDAPSQLPSHGAPGTVPNITSPSQKIVCLYNVSHTSWEQYFIGFTADDDYDMILIYPVVGYRPFQTFPNNADPNVYTSAVAFAYPELVSNRDLHITAGLDNTGSCTTTLSAACGVANAQYTWKDPYGNVIGQGSTADVLPGRPGIYTVEMSVPPSAYASNNVCNENNPSITAAINLAPLNNGRLQLTRATAAYDAKPDGITTFSSGRQTTDFLEASSCDYNFYSVCHFIDEGYLELNFRSNQATGNLWEVYRDNQLVPTPSGNATYGVPAPDNTLQDFTPVIGFIEFRVPTVFEVRLTNKVLNETISLFITLKPQAHLTGGRCVVAASPAGWLATTIDKLYTMPATQFVWDMSNAPGSFQYTQPASTDPNIVYDPATLSGNFTATVRTVGAQYGCERMRTATISPLIDQCDAVYGRMARPGNQQETDPQKKALLLYPNPAMSFLNIVVPKNMVQIDILSIDGRKIRSVTASGTKLTLPLTDIQKGVYLIAVRYKDGTGENKLIIKQ